MAVSIDQQFIEYIIKSIVGHPDEVKIERRIDEKGVLLELSVNPEDLGRVIGKRGATAQSIRTLLRALGTKNDARYNLKIIDTGYPEGKGPRSDDRQQTTDDRKTTEDEGPKTDDTAAPVADLPTEASAKAGEPAASTDEPSTTAADDVDMTEDEELPETASREEDHSDVVSRTRKELADLDDLDV